MFYLTFKLKLLELFDKFEIDKTSIFKSLKIFHLIKVNLNLDLGFNLSKLIFISYIFGKK